MDLVSALLTRLSKKKAEPASSFIPGGRTLKPKCVAGLRKSV